MHAPKVHFLNLVKCSFKKKFEIEINIKNELPNIAPGIISKTHETLIFGNTLKKNKIKNKMLKSIKKTFQLKFKIKNKQEKFI